MVMKILIATPLYPPDIGGPATYAKLMNDRLPEHGFSVDVLSFGEVRKWPKGIRHILYFFKVFFRARSADIIFTQDAVSAGLPVICAAFFARKKVVMRIAGDYAWEQGQGRFGIMDNIDEFQTKSYGWRVEILRMIQKFVIARADRVITPSKYFRNLVAAWNPKAKVVCIYNGIELLKRSDLVTVQPERNLIFSAGRLVPWKGFDVLIKTMTQLPVEWKLVIAGDGPERSKIEELIKELKIGERVELVGAIPRKEVESYYLKASVFVLNTSFESFSFQVVEAMSVGVPVITTDIGNLREIIENEKDGFLIKPNDSQKMIEIIKSLDSDQVLRQSIIDKAKIKVERFSITNTINELVALFNSL